MKDKILLWIEKSKLYIMEVWAEVDPKNGKVSWPNRKMIFGSTIAVIVLSAIISFYIYIVDIISIAVIEKIIGRR